MQNSLAKPAEKLSKRDQYELRKAIEYDSIHKSDPFIGAPKYNADSLERAIEHFLKAKGIRLKYVGTQIASLLVAFLTDLLFSCNNAEPRQSCVQSR